VNFMSVNNLLSQLTAYAAKHTARFHMPGHKGRLLPPFDGVAPIDLTELPDTGDLYHEPSGAIRRSEQAMAALYGAQDCLYLTGGATQGIYAMLSAVTRPGDTVHVARSCHRSVYNALVLLDLRPVWFFGEPPVTNNPVIYVSPDYYGKITPKPETKGVVLCDAAHGAHLPFCTDNYKPPGSLWVVSAHKTLGALGQTAMLLSDGTADAGLLRERTALFGTASPSFVLLASLDAAREELERGGRQAWVRVIEFNRRFCIEGHDPAKIVVHTPDGIGEAQRLARQFGVVCEMADAHRIVFMLSPHNTEEDFTRLEQALATVGTPCMASGSADAAYCLPAAVMTPREAYFAPREKVKLSDAEGRAAARAFAPTPPGIPIIAPGERFDKKTLEILSGMCYTGDTFIWAVRKEVLNV
jgi:lysine decarboxylase